MAEPRACAFEECGVMFEPTRDDARYHSDICRAKANKAKRAADDGDATSAASKLPPRDLDRRDPGSQPRAAAGGDATSVPSKPLPRAPGGHEPLRQPPEGIFALAERVDDLEADFDLSEIARKRIEQQLAKPVFGAEQARALFRAEIQAALAPMVRRLEVAEREVVELRRQPRGVDHARIERVERAVVQVSTQVAAVRSEITEFVTGINTMLPDENT